MNAPDGVWAVDDMVTCKKLTFAESVNKALDESLSADRNVVVGGQLVRYGVAGLTSGLYEKYPEQFITYSVSEALMTSSAMGLALAGKRVVQIHVRMDFLLCGMDALFNQIPSEVKKGTKLPIVFLCQVGKGMGQGAMHSKDLTMWFDRFEGWTVRVPENPMQAHWMVKEAIAGDRPVMIPLHRELFDLPDGKPIQTPQLIKLCGASRRHEVEHYGLNAPKY